jgi:hypothetical protein
VKKIGDAKRILFFPAVICAFLVLDILLAHFIQPYIISSGRFYLNDFEVTQRDHPEETWDRVFFGNSVVISAFREDDSESGYINLGLDDGVVTDLWELICKGYLNIGSELVIGLNSLTMYDDFETNPGYQWHRTWYQPYCYFQRNRLKLLLEDSIRQVLRGYVPSTPYVEQTKSVYYGALSTEEVLARRASDHYQPYLSLGEEDYQENLRALEKVYSYCQSHGIRLRLVWMPENPIVERDAASACAYELTQAFAAQYGVEFYDMSDMLSAECFYDGGHLNYEYGAHVFTEVIEPWLNE